MSIGASPSFDSMSNFPAGFSQGLQVQGIPILNTYAGRVAWVDSVNGSDGNRGTLAKPYASVAGAVRNLLSPGPTVFGDLIICKQGHVERFSAAGMGIHLSGAQIIGLGTGEDRPTFFFDGAGGITVAGSSVTFQNLRFIANAANIPQMVNIVGTTLTASIAGNVLTATVANGSLQPGDVLSSALAGFVFGTKVLQQLSGAPGGVGTYLVNKSQTVASGAINAVARNFNLRGCDILDTSAVLNFLSIVKSTVTTNNVADGVCILGNTISLLSAAGVVNLYAPSGSADRCVIANNHYRAKSTSGTAIIPVAAGKALTNAAIVDNIFDTVGAAGTATALLVSTDQTTNSGVVARNFLQNLATVPLLATAASGLRFFENYYASAPDKSGALLPVV